MDTVNNGGRTPYDVVTTGRFTDLVCLDLNSQILLRFHMNRLADFQFLF